MLRFGGGFNVGKDLIDVLSQLEGARIVDVMVTEHGDEDERGDYSEEIRLRLDNDQVLSIRSGGLIRHQGSLFEPRRGSSWSRLEARLLRDDEWPE